MPVSWRRGVLAAVVLVLLCVAVRAPLLDLPLERDEGEYAYIAWRLEYHELPYRDWVDQKPPAVFWIYRAALWLPLEPVRAIHAMGMLWAALTAIVFWLLARRFLSPGWALLAAALYVLLAADPRVQGPTANTELFMQLPLLLSLLLFLAAAKRGRGCGVHLSPTSRQSAVAIRAGAGAVALLLLAGVFTGVAVACKQVAGVNVLLLVAAYPLLVPRAGRWRVWVVCVGCLALGGAAVWGGIALYFAAHGALPDMVYNVFTHNLEYVSSIPARARLGYLAETLTRLAPSQALVWAAALAGLCALRRETAALLFLGGWALTSAVGISASGYYFPHYFQQGLPVLALLAAVGAAAWRQAAQAACEPKRRRLLPHAVVLLLLPALSLLPFLSGMSPAEASRRIYPGSHFDRMQEVGQRLAAVTQPEDRVFIYGAEPELLFYARRVSATRYIFLFPLYGPYRDAKAKQEATAAEITRQRPAAAVYRPNSLFFLAGTEQWFTQWTQSYLNEQFRLDSCVTVTDAGVLRFVVAPRDEQLQLPVAERILTRVLVRKPE